MDTDLNLLRNQLLTADPNGSASIVQSFPGETRGRTLTRVPETWASRGPSVLTFLQAESSTAVLFQHYAGSLVTKKQSMSSAIQPIRLPVT